MAGRKSHRSRFLIIALAGVGLITAVYVAARLQRSQQQRGAEAHIDDMVRRAEHAKVPYEAREVASALLASIATHPATTQLATMGYRTLARRSPDEWARAFHSTDDPMRHGYAMEAWLYEELALRARQERSVSLETLFDALKPDDRALRPDHPWWPAAIRNGWARPDPVVTSVQVDGSAVLDLAWHGDSRLVGVTQKGACIVTEVGRSNVEVACPSGAIAVSHNARGGVMMLRKHDGQLALHDMDGAVVGVDGVSLVDGRILLEHVSGEEWALAVRNAIYVIGGRTATRLAEMHGVASAIEYSPEYGLIVGLETGTVQCIEASTGRIVWNGRVTKGPCYAIERVPDGRVIAAGSTVGVDLLDGRTGRLEGHIPLQTGSVRALAALSGNRLAVAGDVHSTITIIDVGIVKPVACLYGHDTGIVSLRWNDKDKWLASGGYDGMINVWEISPVAGKK